MENNSLYKLVKEQFFVARDGIIYSHALNVINNQKREGIIAFEFKVPVNLFWKACIDEAALAWCKTFGSDGSEPLHWKKLYNAEDDLQVINPPENWNYKTMDGFRQRIFTPNNLLKEQGKDGAFKDSKEMWEQIKTYRDKHLAHLDIEALENGQIQYPFVEPILRTLTEFATILIEIIKHIDGENHTKLDIQLIEDYKQTITNGIEAMVQDKS